MYAHKVALYINSFCRMSSPNEDCAKLASMMASGEWIDCFDHLGDGSHKYLPEDKLNQDLGLQPDKGVYGYWRMKDGSALLLTCKGPLAWWSGKSEDKAEWGQYAFKEAAKVG